jgi:hypothetical protein
MRTLKDCHKPKSDENDYRSPDMQNSYMRMAIVSMLIDLHSKLTKVS